MKYYLVLFTKTFSSHVYWSITFWRGHIEADVTLLTGCYRCASVASCLKTHVTRRDACRILVLQLAPVCPCIHVVCSRGLFRRVHICPTVLVSHASVIGETIITAWGRCRVLSDVKSSTFVQNTCAHSSIYILYYMFDLVLLEKHHNAVEWGRCCVLF